MITKERAEKLTQILEADLERKQYLLALTPAQAVVEMNHMGYDFTVDEIIEYGMMLKFTISQGDELDLDMLDNVAGGCDNNPPW